MRQAAAPRRQQTGDRSQLRRAVHVRRSGFRSCQKKGFSPGPAFQARRRPLISTPRLAQRDMPATIETGTAKISGHGVATTSTANPRTGSPVTIHAAATTASVTGTARSAYLSANRAEGALVRRAASTSRIMPANVLLAAAVVA